MTDSNVVYPSVFVVDGKANFPLEQRRRRHGNAAQWLLFMLVFLALSGVGILGYFIWDLERRTVAISPDSRVNPVGFPEVRDQPEPLGVRDCEIDIHASAGDHLGKNKQA
ncbi:hypothetical protein EOD39_20561 [Acipenser ruthenus]|uniref:Uncharacterized protein n=1 Tax=Acipenser ruthenus TaxID=7906 RepID=A0A444UV37_ACIRT|nr:hypothetical protein EOD39_20561 [Acipenser ruthenus]